MNRRLVPYVGLGWLLLPCAFARLALKSRTQPAYRQRWGERLGFRAPASVGLWIHAVSLGEVRGAAPLIRALANQESVLVTTGTPTGSDEVQRQFGDRVLHRYLPYDLPSLIDRFLDQTQPRAVLFMETEVWPVLYARLAMRHIPLALVNARLSERSRRRYQRFSWIFRPALQTLALVAAQSQEDAQRFQALGVPETRILVSGNLKFDVPLPDHAQSAAEVRHRLAGTRPVFLAASTHEGEEALIFEAYGQLRRTIPDLVLIVAPRHPERAVKIRRAAPVGHTCRLRSLGIDQPLGPAEWLLVDTLGELPLFVGAADVAFIGGSLVPQGGHNMLEACQAGVPCVFGPHVFNFADISRLVTAAGAGRQIPDLAGLIQAVQAYLADPDLRTRAGTAGRALMTAHAGALDRTLARLRAMRAVTDV